MTDYTSKTAMTTPLKRKHVVFAEDIAPSAPAAITTHPSRLALIAGTEPVPVQPVKTAIAPAKVAIKVSIHSWGMTRAHSKVLEAKREDCGETAVPTQESAKAEDFG
jgi:hypothetical protein